MLVHMRTTMNLPDGLLTEVKAEAARRKRTVTSLMEEALRDLLARVDQHHERPEPRLTTWGTPGGPDPFLVDVSDNQAVQAALDDHA